MIAHDIFEGQQENLTLFSLICLYFIFLFLSFTSMARARFQCQVLAFEYMVNKGLLGLKPSAIEKQTKSKAATLNGIIFPA